MSELGEPLATLGLAARAIEPLAGDASQRRFFRVFLADGGTAVACLYPEGADSQAARDVAVQRWGLARGLPIPRLLGCAGRVTVCDDLGDLDLERALCTTGVDLLGRVLDTLAAFQSCAPDGLETPPFDAPFWRRELAVFERFAVPPGYSDAEAVSSFLDDLAARLAGHPVRLVHRDFHVNNLFWHVGRVWTVDFQDMRSGPDTYDAASLLRERAGIRLAEDAGRWLGVAADRLGWRGDWRRRYLECATQRGLKVVGTFLRLTAEGRSGYAARVAGVSEQAAEALRALDAPEEVLAALRRAAATVGV